MKRIWQTEKLTNALALYVSHSYVKGYYVWVDEEKRRRGSDREDITLNQRPPIYKAKRAVIKPREFSEEQAIS